MSMNSGSTTITVNTDHPQISSTSKGISKTVTKRRSRLLEEHTVAQGNSGLISQIEDESRAHAASNSVLKISRVKRIGDPNALSESAQIQEIGNHQVLQSAEKSLSALKAQRTLRTSLRLKAQVDGQQHTSAGKKVLKMTSQIATQEKIRTSIAQSNEQSQDKQNKFSTPLRKGGQLSTKADVQSLQTASPSLKLRKEQSFGASSQPQQQQLSAFLKKHPSVGVPRTTDHPQSSTPQQQNLIGFGGLGTSSGISLRGGDYAAPQLHPLNVMIKDFQSRRVAANLLDEKRVSASEFLDAFTTQLKEYEAKVALQGSEDGENSCQIRRESCRSGNDEECKIGNIIQQESFGDHMQNVRLTLENFPFTSPSSVFANNHANTYKDTSLQGDYRSLMRESYHQISMQGQSPSNELSLKLKQINDENPYETFEFNPNSLQCFYPKQVQKQVLQKKKGSLVQSYLASAALAAGIADVSNVQTTTTPNPLNTIYLQQGSPLKSGQTTPPTAPEGFEEKKFHRSLEKMRALTECQEQFAKIVTTNVHKRSKSIKKLERQVSDSLRSRKIYLEEANFDILDILTQCAQSVNPAQQAQQLTLQSSTGSVANTGLTSGLRVNNFQLSNSSPIVKKGNLHHSPISHQVGFGIGITPLIVGKPSKQTIIEKHSNAQNQKLSETNGPIKAFETPLRKGSAMKQQRDEQFRAEKQPEFKSPDSPKGLRQPVHEQPYSPHSNQVSTREESSRQTNRSSLSPQCIPKLQLKKSQSVHVSPSPIKLSSQSAKKKSPKKPVVAGKGGSKNGDSSDDENQEEHKHLSHSTSVKIVIPYNYNQIGNSLRSSSQAPGGGQTDGTAVQVLQEEQMQNKSIVIDCDMVGMLQPNEELTIDRDYRKLSRHDNFMLVTKQQEIDDDSSSYTFGEQQQPVMVRAQSLAYNGLAYMNQGIPQPHPRDQDGIINDYLGINTFAQSEPSYGRYPHPAEMHDEIMHSHREDFQEFEKPHSPNYQQYYQVLQSPMQQQQQPISSPMGGTSSQLSPHHSIVMLNSCCVPQEQQQQTIPAMSYYDYQNEDQALIHPLEGDQGCQSDQVPELIVCDGGPNCIYNQHYQAHHEQYEESHQMQHYQPDLNGLIIVGTHIGLPEIMHQDMQIARYPGPSDIQYSQYAQSDSGSILEEGGSYQHPLYPEHNRLMHYGHVAPDHLSSQQQCVECEHRREEAGFECEHDQMIHNHPHSDESYIAHSQILDGDTTPIKGAFLLTPSAAQMRKKGNHDLMEF
ncbi:hypothetical protein FGO68_gene5474 [Halteria grandinella]|uniref:Uncharacterized protein n=1 Tax=Halteria grandinella TaxID=5974 RepID=A0A8J8P3Q1_HALGN|nr:hypothetical protein FGO68_gene5474 [Halteria grandinella]